VENPDTIRGRFGLTDTRNATHGSDSPTSATAEILFFFPDFNIDEWYEKEEAIYRRSLEEEEEGIEFDKERWLHQVGT